MADIGLFELLVGMGSLLAIFLGGNVAYTHWRIKHLEDCLTGHKQKHDSDIHDVHRRLDAHIDKQAD
jgi:hypothetical protein